MIDVDQTEPAAIDDFADRGFRGLKIINPRRNYDDPTYFPLYAVAERRMLRSEVSTFKLVWGSDCDMAHMSRELTNWMQAFDEIGLSAEERDQIFWGTAAHIFGVED